MPNYVGQALQNLGNTLQTGMTQYGQGELQRAKLEYEMNDPVEMRKRQEVQAAIEFDKKPFTLAGIGNTTDMGDLMYRANMVETGRKTLSTIIGEEVELTEDKQLRKADGSVFSNAEIKPYMGIISNMIGLNTSRKRYLETQAKKEKTGIQEGIVDQGSFQAQDRWNKFQKDEGAELDQELEEKMKLYASIPAQFREDETFNKMALAGIEETRNDIKRYDDMQKVLGKEERSFKSQLDKEYRELKEQLNKESRAEIRELKKELRGEDRQLGKEARSKVDQKEKELRSKNEQLLKEKREEQAKIRTEKRAETKPPGISQQLDDARQFYSLKMRSLIDPLVGGVKEGKETEHNALMDNLAKDLILINKGKKPTYLRGKQKTETRRGKDKSGRTVIQYSDGTIDYAN